MGCYPSSGIMAVLYAIDHCERTTVYGFGVSKPAAAEVWCADADASDAKAEAHACAVGLACDKYYPRLGEPDQLRARAERCRKVRAGEIERNGIYGAADYFKEAATYHDIVQEWLWLAELHRRGAIVWRGQPGPESSYGDSLGKMMMEPR